MDASGLGTCNPSPLDQVGPAANYAIEAPGAASGPGELLPRNALQGVPAEARVLDTLVA